MRTLRQTVAKLDAGGSSRALLEECLARIDDPAGEGRRAFLKVHRDAALAAADRADRLRKDGRAGPPFAGIPVSIKDLFDIAGDVTAAGSVALKDAKPATRDAPAVARLKAAGVIAVGRTNMTEFAYSGLGINPHYDTPRNPYDRPSGRIPGGSSSGAAVSITDGMAFGALGTDTGGSCRIPAALCGIVGFKPTQNRVPTEGAFPLSPSLDSIGPLAASVDCCAVLDAVLAGEPSTDLPAVDPRKLRLAVPQTLVLDGLDRHVAPAFDAALKKIDAAGIRVSEIPFKELAELASINAKGGLVAYESWQVHRELIAKKRDRYDPRVLVRILRGQEQSGAEYEALKRARADFIRRAHEITAPYDALILPTTPIIAPTLAELEPEGAYRDINMLILRNPAIANFVDGCAISIPCHRAGDAPVGLMLMGTGGTDRRLLAVAAAIERLVSPDLAV
jgi:aspartyl-tRNA(Asn)/glutamyl-tRNA(Gln) amidotransferase subunit A